MRNAVLAAALALAGCTGPHFERPVELAPAELTPYAARVEAARGARFVRPPRAGRVGPAALRRLLARELDAGGARAALARDTELASSLGLVPPGFAARDALLAFEAANVAGFYSPEGDRLFLAEAREAPVDDELMLHELTHALQAQRTRSVAALAGLRGDDDLGFALSAWLEGEATFVALAGVAAYGGAARPTPAAFAAQALGPEAAPTLPRAVAAPLLAVYPLGYAFVDARAARAGLAGLDAGDADPPLASASLLHPERPPTALRELSRAPSLRGCRVRATNAYGELVVRSWLEERGVATATEAAAAWRADRAWRFACGGRAGSAWLLEAAGEAEAAHLAGALRAAGAPLFVEQRGVRVLASRGLRPGERAALLGLAAPRAFASLAAYLAAHPEVERRARRRLP